MQRFIYFFMIFALSLATDVSIYNDFEQYYRRHDAKPAFESAAPWKFEFTSSERRLFMVMYTIRKSPSVTQVILTNESDHKLVALPVTLSNGKKVDVSVHQLSVPEVIINLNVYTSNGLCRSIRVAEGRLVAKKSEREHKYTDICFKEITKPCVSVINLEDVICEGPSIVTRKSKNLTTTTPITDLENNNTTFESNVSPSPHENMNTPTNSFTNNTDVQPTNDRVIIIGSICGITLILIAIAILIQTRVIRCCIKHSPQATPDLPTNPHTEPFYLNILFRRECAQEIAQIEQHEYEEIHPQQPQRVPEGS